jgi:hypothetical protein
MRVDDPRLPIALSNRHSTKSARTKKTIRGITPPMVQRQQVYPIFELTA